LRARRANGGRVYGTELAALEDEAMTILVGADDGAELVDAAGDIEVRTGKINCLEYAVVQKESMAVSRLGRCSWQAERSHHVNKISDAKGEGLGGTGNIDSGELAVLQSETKVVPRGTNE